MLLEQNPFVRDVLVNRHEADTIHRNDEAIVHLPQRFDVVGNQRQIVRRLERRMRKVRALGAKTANANAIANRREMALRLGDSGDVGEGFCASLS